MTKTRASQARAPLTRTQQHDRYRRAWMHITDAGSAAARFDHPIGCRKPGSTSHQVLDKALALPSDAPDQAHAGNPAVVALRAGRLCQPEHKLKPSRPQ